MQYYFRIFIINTNMEDRHSTHTDLQIVYRVSPPLQTLLQTEFHVRPPALETRLLSIICAKYSTNTTPFAIWDVETIPLSPSVLT